MSDVLDARNRNPVPWILVIAILLIAPPLAGGAATSAMPAPPLQGDPKGAGSEAVQAPDTPSLEDLEKRLRDPDATARDIAAVDLVRAPGAAKFIHDLLAGVVKPEDEPVVTSLLEAIGALGATQYLPEVLDLSSLAGGNAIRDTARATILKMRRNPAAAGVLLRIFGESVDDPVRRRAAVRFLEEYRCLTCVPVLIEAGEATPPPPTVVRVAIVRALTTITGEEFGNDWSRWSEWKAKVFVADAAGKIDWAQVADHVNETLRERVRLERERVIELSRRILVELKDHDSARYKEELVRLLKESAYPEIRAEAAERIGHLGEGGDGAPVALTAADVDLLMGALEDPDSRVVARAVGSLGRAALVERKDDDAWGAVLGRIRERIVPLIRSEFPEVRRAAVEAAGRAGGEEIASALRGLLEELVGDGWRDGPLREAVIRALGEPRCASSGSIGILAKVLAGDPVAPNRERAADALGRARDEAAIEPLTKALEGDGVTRVRWAAVRSLEQIGGDRSLEVLTAGLGDPTEGIRLRCASALGNLGRGESVGPLVELLERDESREVRRTVIDSLGRIGSPEAIDPLLRWLERGETAVAAAAQVALDSIWDEKAELLVGGGTKLVAIASRKKDLAAFAVATLERAVELLRERASTDAVLVRARAGLAAAYFLDGKVARAEEIYAALNGLRDQLERRIGCEVLIGLERCRAARGEPAQAYDALRAAARSDTFDPATPLYWKVVATAARIMLDAGDAEGLGPAEKADAYDKARAVLIMSERPAGLPADVVEGLDRLAEEIRARLQAVSRSTDRAEEERIKDVILELASEETANNDERLGRAIQKIQSIPLAKSVPYVISYLEDRNPKNREHAFRLLCGLFPAEKPALVKLGFDPKGEQAGRDKAVAAIRDWWAKHPKNPTREGKG